MKKTLTLLVMAGAIAGIAGCNTIQGIGQDIQAAGKGLESGSETVEDEISGNKSKDESDGN